MADPTKYSRGYSFSNYQANTPNQPLPATRLDVELDDIAGRLGEAVDAIKDVRRADGKIKAGAIDADSFDADLLNELLDGAVEAAENSADAAMASQVAAAASQLAAAASALSAAAAAATSVANAALLGVWRGAWVTATAYAAGDRVSNAGNTYYATVAHTSAALFSTDLSALRWGIVAEKGAAGAGTGDVLAANNGSDFAHKPTTLANLGGQPVNANLTAESGLTGAADRVSYFTGVGAKALAVLTSFGRSLIAAADAAAARTLLGLGTSALVAAPVRTEFVTTSGTEFDVTSIPAGVNWIRGSMDRMSLSGGADDFLLRLGTSGGLVATGYSGGSGVAPFSGANPNSTGFRIQSRSSGGINSGSFELRRNIGDVWTFSAVTMAGSAGALAAVAAGSVDLGADLTQLRFMQAGSDTFDNGNLVIEYGY